MFGMECSACLVMISYHDFESVVNATNVQHAMAYVQLWQHNHAL